MIETVTMLINKENEFVKELKEFKNEAEIYKTITGNLNYYYNIGAVKEVSKEEFTKSLKESYIRIGENKEQNVLIECILATKNDKKNVGYLGDNSINRILLLLRTIKMMRTDIPIDTYMGDYFETDVMDLLNEVCGNVLEKLDLKRFIGMSDEEILNDIPDCFSEEDKEKILWVIKNEILK